MPCPGTVREIAVRRRDASAYDDTPVLFEGTRTGRRKEIRDLVHENLAKHEYPREIESVEALPTTATGKIQRRKLRNREPERGNGIPDPARRVRR